MRNCINYQHYNTDNISVKYENSLRTNDALRKQIKILENNIHKLSKAYYVEESMNNHIVSLTKQVNDLKIENDRARKYIALTSMDLYKTVYGRDF